jgi:YHS domain-containing protein
MLEGYDVVAYFTAGKAVPGSARHRFEYESVAYHFASEAGLAAFKQNPGKFQPAYHGYDATGMVYALPDRADPQHWRLIDGRLFFFADAASMAAFELDTAANIALADRYWKAEVDGHNSAWQRTRRLLDRVPHYKSREELAREVAAAQAKSG